jgi:hypothetical protein
VNILDVMQDEEVFGPWFSGSSWGAWKVILKGANALPMTDDELHTFRELAGGRNPPAKRVRQLFIVGGRRGGKDSIASLLAVWAATLEEGHRGLLRPGERAVVQLIACDREQSKIVLGYIRSYFEEIPELRGMVERETANGFELNNGVSIVITTNSFRNVRGQTILLSIFDEVAFWRDEASARPDVETYRAILPGLSTIPGSMLVAISSPYRKAGLLYEKWRAHFGKDSDDILVIQAASTVLNPTLDQALVDAALEDDPQAASSEWLAQFRGDVSGYVDREIVEGAVESGVLVRPPSNRHGHVAFVDPSGGSSDSMTLAIAHREIRDNAPRYVLNVVVEKRPPFSPDATVREFAAVLKGARIHRVIGDRYAGEWPREAFRTYGITYEPSERNKSEIYLAFLPLLMSGSVDLLDNQRLVNQLASLERRTARGGRDSVDHPHDDVANAVAGALVLATTRAPMRISDAALARAAQPARGSRPPLVSWSV